MHLTTVLLRTLKSKIRDPRVPTKLMPGNIWTGKHRLYEKVKISHKRAAVNQLLLEEQNRKYLSTPFLTAEQEKGHMDEKIAKYTIECTKKEYGKNMRPHRQLEDALKHLNHNKRWEY